MSIEPLQETSERNLISAKKTAIFLQNACLQHKYIRSKDLSNIVERPERLRAVTIGLSAAIARLGELIVSHSTVIGSKDTKSRDISQSADDLVQVMDKLRLDPASNFQSPVKIIESQASLDMMNHPAVKFIHGDIEKDTYLESLRVWIKESARKIAEDGSEIPEGYSQGDLYLCPDSLGALQGAVGTVCEAVDSIFTTITSTEPLHRAFVAIRPPGHHCGEDTPSGFCFLNNVAVGAAHAHLTHGIKRIVIFDIDLHHGNGTQSIVWQINEETYRQTLESEGGASDVKPGPRLYYGSIHDILSYPCEDGKPQLVQAASVSINGSHGQHIENIHLETYTSEDHFWNVLYKEKYCRLLQKAKSFLDETGGPGDDVLFFISCGMDACEHEYESMSRHNKKVPVSFYHRFARDACALSDRYAGGRLISVLEGGYSDRALISGALAHMSGLVDVPVDTKVDESWWNLDNLVRLEQVTKKRRGGNPSLSAQGTVIEPWIENMLAIFTPLDNAAQQAAGVPAPRSSRISNVPTSDRTLRDRTHKNGIPTSGTNSTSSRRGKPVSKAKSDSATTPPKSPTRPTATDVPLDIAGSLTSSRRDEPEIETISTKKLPRVILKIRKPEGP